MKSNSFWNRHVAACSLVALASALGCGGSGNGENPSGTSSSSGTAGSGGNGSGGEGGAGSGGAGQGGAGSGGSSGQGGAGGGSMAGFAAVVLPSSRAVLEADNGGALSVQCGVQKDGMPYGGAFTSKVTVAPQAGVVENAGTYTFTETGTFDASCEVVIEGQTLSATVPISVLNEAIKPALAKAGIGISGVENGIFAVMAANGGTDQALKDAVAALDKGIADLDPAHYQDLTDVLRKIPGDYPTPAKLDAAGVTKTTGDDELGAAISEVSSSLAALRTAIASIDPMALKASDETELSARRAALETAVQKVNALNLTAHGVIANRNTLATLVRDEIAPTTRAMGQLVTAAAKAEAGAVLMVKGQGQTSSAVGTGTNDFGFLSLTMGMFNQNALLSQMINGMYGELIDAIDKSINNLILLDAIDYLLPPNPQGPVIDMLFASSSQGFSKVGYDTWVYGSGFNKDPNMNIFIIIGDGWQTIVENIFSACGVGDANTLPEMVDTVEQCIKDVQEAATNSLPTDSMEVIEPGTLGAQDVHLGPFPPACSSAIPLAIGIIPVNLATGRGATWKSNCIK